MPAAGRDHHREGHEPHEPEPRPGDRHDDEDERKVVQPHDRGQRERGREREDERVPLGSPPAHEHDGRDEREPEREPDPASDRRGEPEVEPDDVRRVGVLADRLLEAAQVRLDGPQLLRRLDRRPVLGVGANVDVQLDVARRRRVDVLACGSSANLLLFGGGGGT